MNRQPLKDIQFIADFAAFCRTKGDETYDFMSNEDCALAQFLRASGRCADPRVRGFGVWRDAADPDRSLHQAPVCPAGRGTVDVMGAGPATFPALAGRLEALLVDAPEIEVVK